MPKLPEHIAKDIADQIREEAKRDQATLLELIARYQSISELYAGATYRAVLAHYREDLEQLRNELEAPQTEAETVYLRGQIKTLRQILDLPQRLRDQITALHERLKEPDVVEQNRGAES